MTNQSVVLHRRMYSNKHLWWLTVFSTLDRWLTERVSCYINIWIWVSSYKVEYFCKTRTIFIAKSSSRRETSVWMTTQNAKNIIRNLEKCIKEGTSHNTAKILTKKSEKGGNKTNLLFWSKMAPVPINNTAWDTEIESIPQKLHSPDKLKNIQNTPYSRIIQIVKYLTTSSSGNKAEVLP